MRRWIIVALIALVVSETVFGAIAYVQSPTPIITSAGTSHPITITGVTAGSLLVVNVGYSNEAETVSVADDKSNTWATAVGPCDSPTAIMRGYQFYAKNVAAGDTVITATITNTIAISLHVTEYSGAHATAPLDDTVCADIASDQTPSANLDPTGTGRIIGHFRAASNKGFTAGTNYTVRDTSIRGDTEDRAVSAGVYTLDGTYDAVETGVFFGAVYLEAAGAASGWPQGSQQLLIRGGP